MADDVVQSSRAAAQSIAHVPPLLTLKDKVRPEHTALVVIDVQNDFCASDGFVAKGGRDVSLVQEMTKRLPAFIAQARDASVRVIFVRCAYSTPQNLFLSDVWLEQAARRQGGGYTLSPVCQSGERGAEYYDVQPQPSDIIVVKHRYDAFHATDLDLVLRANAVRTVVLAGVSTHVCVETTARSAFVRDYYTVVVADGCAAYSAEEHQASLRVIDRFFGEVAGMADIVPHWPKHARK
ncbi:MAG TPA: isochorismatase family cysteine hydrolase [Pseudolabrys sp.]|nr:isochorismatase family cysteine hydrolase [Pseudolabrys sp.]